MEHRQERIEEQLNVEKDENVVLRRMLEESQESAEHLTDELRIRNSRVMQLESDLFFMAGDLDEKSIVEEDLREMCKQLQKKVDKLEAEKRNAKKLKDMYYKTKVRI